MHLAQAAKILMLATAISIDAFGAAFSYGTDNIKIPPRSSCIIHLLSLTFICIAVKSGAYISKYLSPHLINAISVCLLLILGTAKLFDGFIKSALQKTEHCKKDISFSLMSLKFILSVYADPKTADADCSKTLSPKEATVLAVTLSVDSLPIGVGIGLSSFPLWQVIPAVILADEVALRLGQFLGKKAAKKLHHDISWLGGALLIIMALI